VKSFKLLLLLAFAGIFAIAGCGSSGGTTPGNDNGGEGITASCGNGTCETGEDCANCAADCACTTGQTCQNGVCLGISSCGNAKCETDKGENCSTCPDDCACANGKICNNGKCIVASKCGNGTCDADENCSTCAADCACTNGQKCYNNACCTPKTCNDLALDCGHGNDACGGSLDCGKCDQGKVCAGGKCIVASKCGNGTCDADENCSTCAADCACVNGQICYNKACCTPKTCADIGLECGTGDDTCGGGLTCGNCDQGKACDNGKCVASPKCGDGTCDANENCSTCAPDCACADGQKCYKDACCIPKTCDGLGLECGTGDDTCGSALACGLCEQGKVCDNGKCVANPDCGNGTCDANKGENCNTCPADCGCEEGQTCYDDACCTPKTCDDLGLECGNGDDSCGTSLNCGVCAQGKACDNGKCVANPQCGDGTCDTNENCGSCPDDCACTGTQICAGNGSCVDCTPEGQHYQGGMGSCCQGLASVDPIVPNSDTSCPTPQHPGDFLCVDCGNGTCDANKGENYCNCPDDCVKPPPTCGDGTCDDTENCNSCAKDCACKDTQICAGTGNCVDCTTEGNTFPTGLGACCDGLTKIETSAPDNSGACPDPAPRGAYRCTKCGNGTCDADKGENYCNCPDDCNQACTPKTCADLNFSCGLGDDSCQSVVNCGSCGNGQGTCQGGTCSTMDDCKAMASCLSACDANDTDCKNLCIDKASDYAKTTFVGFYDCLDQNKCWDDNDKLIQDCLNAHCTSEYYQCFGGDTYMSCNDLSSCLGACASNDQTCVNKCWNDAYPIAGIDFDNLITCMREACKTECADTSAPACTSCLTKVQGEGGVCYDETMACHNHMPYDGGTCSDMIGCSNACSNSHCMYDCLYKGTRKAQQMYADMLTCVSQTCQTACTEPDSVQCNDCWSQSQSEGGACYDKVTACNQDR